jgi:cysteinyl-tRNA synthetase
LSIGEAEDYRSYWKPSWKLNPPDFLMKENPDWPGNYGVKFWVKSWQQIILEEIDKITAQGFDGLYLDKVDLFEDFEYDPDKKDWLDNRINPATKQSYRKDMIASVQAVAKHARKKNRSALIIPQNGSPLLEDRSFRQAINGIGIEDLFTDGEQKQDEEEIRYIISFLKKLKKEDKPILCVEYPEEANLKIFVRQKAKRLGCRLLITDRELTTLGETE